MTLFPARKAARAAATPPVPPPMMAMSACSSCMDQMSLKARGRFYSVRAFRALSKLRCSVVSYIDMRILGLTGDIACGKSTVARLLNQKGAETLDSDLLVREIYADPAFAKLVQGLFESSIIGEGGAVDRAKLADVVFQDKVALQKLEELVFPAVAKLRESKLQQLASTGQEVVVIEAVKLLESGQGAGCDAIWCVVCAPEVQLKRMVENRGMAEAEAQARLRHQPSRDDKLFLAGQTPLVWIENDRSLAELEALVEGQWKRFLA
ncbi:dephospho-CoA kinase [bacterium]|nr:MAG: dephospho-CoA kinase [bacterium]